jgi:hypothetical protein
MPSARPRRTYVISLYDAERSVVVEAIQRDERARVEDLDGLPARIRAWEAEDEPSPDSDAAGGAQIA